MIKKGFIAVLFLIWGITTMAQVIEGRVLDENNKGLQGATIVLQPKKGGAYSDDKGFFAFENVPMGNYELRVTYVGYYPMVKKVSISAGEKTKVEFILKPNDEELAEVEVFGERYKQPKKMEAITRMPLRPNEQVQNISVISHKMLTEQGVQTLSDAVRNVPGITTFATYGNTMESLTARGYRGIPILKNGVRVNSDFRGTGFITDMQGVETIQILKGSASMSQGLGNDLGSAGGVVNIATKVPHFKNVGEIGLYVGSWGKVRPSFDVQRILTKSENVAFRLNGALERAESYRAYVSGDRVYVNPSLSWRPDDKTEIVLELDYLHDSRTPDQGTVNLAADSINNIYDMPHSKFLGMENDRAFQNNTTYTTRIRRDLGNGYSLRFAYFGSQMDKRNVRAHSSPLRTAKKTGEYNKRYRRLSSAYREDKNNVFQLDFIGKDIFTGKIKHTFNVGIDYKTSNVETASSNTIILDTIDVLKQIPNTYTLARGQALEMGTPVETREYSYGAVAQDVITFNDYVKLTLGLRYGMVNGMSRNAVSSVDGDAFDPLVGLIITPFKDFNLFASYTSTTSLRGAANLLTDGVTTVGPTREKQYEAGFKSEWFNHRLRFNTTVFKSKNDNLTYAALNDSGQRTGYYIKAGKLDRQGVELEVTGRVLPNMDIVAGYTYLEAEYHDSPYYHEGSSPMNTTKHTANGWVNYAVDKGALKNLSFGAGIYYVGKRPLAEYTYQVLPGHDVQPNTPPFFADAYTTVNMQVGYVYNRLHFRAFLNNMFDSVGYTAYYRGGYLNPTDPRNVAFSVTYKF